MLYAWGREGDCREPAHGTAGLTSPGGRAGRWAGAAGGARSCSPEAGHLLLGALGFPSEDLHLTR